MIYCFRKEIVHHIFTPKFTIQIDQPPPVLCCSALVSSVDSPDSTNSAPFFSSFANHNFWVQLSSILVLDQPDDVEDASGELDDDAAAANVTRLEGNMPACFIGARSISDV